MSHAGYVLGGWGAVGVVVAGYAWWVRDRAPARRPAPPRPGAPVVLGPEGGPDPAGPAGPLDPGRGATGLDLTPRPEGRRRRRRPVGAIAVLVAVVVVAAFILLQGLGNATLYFRNADEAVAQRQELGDRRFRLQGTVQTQPVSQGGTTDFAVVYNGVVVQVHHAGDPVELFDVGRPVVLEGHWDGTVFASDRMMVKHSEEYKAENPDRVTPDGP